MIGKQQIVFDANKFIAGMGASDYAPDGGLGTSSFNINPFITPGVMYSIGASTDSSTNLASDVIASCEDSQSVSAYGKTLVDNAANYYTFNSGTLTKRNTGTATSHYTFGKTDMVAFSNNTYVTLDNDIAQWNTSTFTLTESWWVGTKGKTALNSSLPHPLLVFESLLWVADGSNLHSIDSSGNITLNVLQFNSNELIQALSIDPFTGLMLISIQTTINYSDIVTSRFYVYLYDGYSSKPRRKIVVDDLVTAFYPVGGQVYVGYGQRLGMWNGNGITFLRRLAFDLNGSNLLYKHHFSSIGHILLVVNKTNVLAYGEVVAGKKGFYNLVQSPNGNLKWASNLGNNLLGINYDDGGGTPKLLTFDISTASAGSGSLYFSFVQFERPIYIRGMRVITTGITTTTGLGDATIFSESSTLQPPGALGQFVVASGTKYVFDFNFTSTPVMLVQPRINMDSQSFGIIRVIVYYDVAE